MGNKQSKILPFIDVKAKQEFNIDVESMLKLPFTIFWKNKEGHYLGGNDLAISVLGLRDKSEYFGATIFDLLNKTTAEFIDKIDNTIMNKSTTSYSFERIEPKYAPPLEYLSLKIPLYNNHNKIAGLLGISVDIKKLDFVNTIEILGKIGATIDKQRILQLQDDYYNKNSIAGVQFSRRERECIYYLIKGRTNKEIARYLNLSPRTVESHIAKVKARLNCHTKSQLLDKLLEETAINFLL